MHLTFPGDTAYERANQITDDVVTTEEVLTEYLTFFCAAPEYLRREVAATIRYQQNVTGRKIAIVVLGNSTWRVVRLYLDRVALAVDAATPGSYTEVDIPFK